MKKKHASFSKAMYCLTKRMPMVCQHETYYFDPVICMKEDVFINLCMDDLEEKRKLDINLHSW